MLRVCETSCGRMQLIVSQSNGYVYFLSQDLMIYRETLLTKEDLQPNSSCLYSDASVTLFYFYYLLSMMYQRVYSSYDGTICLEKFY